MAIRKLVASAPHFGFLTSSTFHTCLQPPTPFQVEHEFTRRSIPVAVTFKTMAKEGRPTKYKDDTNQIALGYIDSCGENYIAIEKPVMKDGVLDEETIIKKEIKLPTYEGLSILLGVHMDTIYEWKAQHQEFSYTLELLKKKQKEMLMQNGLSGDYNMTIAKLILSANHGVNEKTENESTVKVTDETISPEDKDKLLSLLNDKASS